MGRYLEMIIAIEKACHLRIFTLHPNSLGKPKANCGLSYKRRFYLLVFADPIPSSFF